MMDQKQQSMDGLESSRGLIFMSQTSLMRTSYMQFMLAQ
nr:MAG TPA: hypothetical protein [Caudoviricetes sp.]